MPDDSNQVKNTIHHNTIEPVWIVLVMIAAAALYFNLDNIYSGEIVCYREAGEFQDIGLFYPIIPTLIICLVCVFKIIIYIVFSLTGSISKNTLMRRLILWFSIMFIASFSLFMDLYIVYGNVVPCTHGAVAKLENTVLMYPVIAIAIVCIICLYKAVTGIILYLHE
jgi:hypothetical protein